MTKAEFSGPSLSSEQWHQIDALATSLISRQAVWISGFFAGFGHQLRTSATDAAGPFQSQPPQALQAQTAPSRSLTILFATETGNCAGLARSAVQAATTKCIPARLSDVAEYNLRGLKDEQDLLLITSTHREGDAPQPALAFFEFLESRKAPKLPNLRFAVLALGDSTYERYCEAGKRADRRFEELGAQRLLNRVDCDVDFEQAAAAWIEEVLNKLTPTAQILPTPASNLAAEQGNPAAVTSDKKHPFSAPVIENIVLTGRGSSKEVRHIELSLASSGLTYQPGDALGIVAENDPALVAALIDRLGLSGGALVSVGQDSVTLADALAKMLEITTATPRFLDHWSEITNSSKLLGLRASEQSEARNAFLRTHHVIDIIERFPAPGISADTLLAGLRPLQPRLYSIASSLAAAPDEVHLTVGTVTYELHGRPRNGVASAYLATHPAETEVPAYIQPNAHFHLPNDDASILMVGAGTGVAPYRAFMQERDARGAVGRSWLVFGERNFRSDFLYQVEWQALLKKKVLSRMDVAFSRDLSAKTYVQDRLRQNGRDVYAWLQDGAYVYVCGDAVQMASGVHAALVDIIERHGDLDRESANEYLTSLSRDRRYRLDVY